jgi:hypothetical protein
MKAVALQSQFKHEHKAWERSLEFFRQENTLLKYRLSEIVDHNEEKKLIQLAEYFQNELLRKDEKINHLIKELQGFSGGFNEATDGKMAYSKIIVAQENFRNQVLQLEKEFLLLSKDFNESMLRNI